MRFTDYFRIALGNIARQKMRSALTIFAVVIGATSVTIMLALVTGAKSFVKGQYESSGALQQVIVTQSPDLDYKQATYGGTGKSATGVILNDALLAKVKAVPHVVAVTPMVDVHVFDALSYNGKKLNLEHTSAYEPNGVLKHTIISGRELNETDGDGSVVITDDYAKKFGFTGKYTDVIGKQIDLITSDFYTGEGATITPPQPMQPGENSGPTNKPQNGNGGQVITIHANVVGVVSGDDSGPTVYFPLNWAKKLLVNQRYETTDADQKAMAAAQQAQQAQMRNPSNKPQSNQPPPPIQPKYTLVKESQLDQQGYQNFTAKVDSTKNVDGAAAAIKGLGVGAATAASYVKSQLTVFNIIGLVLGGIGGIALLVAAIGVINTMFMAILERTREIGVMRACGATKAHVRRLFTFEAAILGFFGGAFGLLVGYGLTKIANNLLNKQFSTNGLNSSNIITLPLWLIGSVLLTTTLIGVVAGLYPASRAARLNPVEALRYE